MRSTKERERSDTVMIGIKKSGNPTVQIDNLPEFLTLREVAGIFRISVLTVKRMCKRGDMEFIRINTRGDRRFKKASIINFINRYETVKS